MPKISVIVPAYNAEKYLRRCIDSILVQTFTDFELLLVNDGSNDRTDTICNEYAVKESRIRVFHKKNGGVSSARNIGLDNAKGKYVMFVDSDDFMLSDMCELMISTLNAKNADLVICGTTETGGGYWRPQEDRDYSIKEFKKDFIHLLHTELLSPPWNKIYKRDKIGNRRFHEDISFGEDLLFNILYMDTCESISFIKASPFYHEKGNENSLVVKFDRKRLLDIEKVWLSVDEFSENKKGLYFKYLRDLTVYARQLFKTEQYSWVDKKCILKEWCSVSRLRNLNLLNYKVDYVNWILLLLLKLEQWELANIIVNIKLYLKCK